MAKVKIQGHASGTGILTVTAPNTSTDRTITLPDATATLMTNAGGTFTGDLAIGSYTANSNADNLVIQEANDFTGITLAADNDQGSNIYFADPEDNNVGGITYNHSSNYMNFRVNGAERLRVLSSGGLTFNGDTAAANALDDYEEGTWTPVVTGTGGAPSSSTFHTNPSGKYTKVGRLVTVQFYLHINTLTGGSGTLKLTGVPFTPMAASGGFKGTVSMYYANASSNSSPVLQINSSGAFLAIEVANGSGGYLSNVSWVNAPLSAFASATAMSGTVTFMAA